MKIISNRKRFYLLGMVDISIVFGLTGITYIILISIKLKKNNPNNDFFSRKIGATLFKNESYHLALICITVLHASTRYMKSFLLLNVNTLIKSSR
jgi:hypothetical protein